MSFPTTGPLLQGKRGLIMGVANDHSIAWGIAEACAAHGAELAFTYQGEPFLKRITPLAESVGAKLVVPCDVENTQSLEAAFAAIDRAWGGIDFLVHAIAFADKKELRGRYIETSRENFRKALDISCYSFTEVCRRAEPLMHQGGSCLTLSYGGAARVVPGYNVMGVAKAALESSVRYLAADMGVKGVRVNAISAGPMRTLSGSAVQNARFLYNWNVNHSPLKREITLGEVGGAALYLLSNLSGGVTGEIHYVDAGYSIVGMPRAEDVRNGSGGEAD